MNGLTLRMKQVTEHNLTDWNLDKEEIQSLNYGYLNKGIKVLLK